MHFLDTARSIGNHLVATAVWELDRCNWTGDEIEHVGGKWQVIHRAVDGSLYSGSAGIARFLAHLWSYDGGDAYRTTALAALRRSLDTAERSPSIAFWSGATGIACAALDIGQILAEPTLWANGLTLARRVAGREVPRLLAQGRCGLDVISGLAGALMGLVYVSRRFADATIGEACDAIVNRLLQAACKRPVGWSWPMDEGDDNGQHLCGLAHGASGVALALMEAHSVWHNRALAEAAWHAVDYENCWFDQDRSNWPDLRVVVEQEKSNIAALTPRECSCFWCHGASGIGLARLRLYQLTGDPRALADASAALQAIVRTFQPILTGSRLAPIVASDWNFSVCHGVGSAMEVILYTYRMTRRAEYLRAADALAWAGIRAAASEGMWRCGVPQGGEHPGAMVGLAGIGMEYLALVDARVPPVTVWA